MQKEAIYVEQEYAQDAALLRENYTRNAHELSRFKKGHLGLRFYRHYGEEQYLPLFFEGIELAEHSLNLIYKRGLDEASIQAYIKDSNKKYYSTSTSRKRLRSYTLDEFPEYRFYATKLLRHVARLDEVGLRHQHHDKFIGLLTSYDFESAFTNKKMIRAWGAQLANQVYWLKQIGIVDYTNEFLEAVELTYPESKDRLLNKQQFENKLYTLTHVIIAASGYYQFKVDYKDYSEIIDYLRGNVDTIIERAKEDVIIEVGIALLLTGEDYPEIDTIRRYISQRINRDARMIPSPSGKTDFALGEHRNVIAVLLLDWQGVFERPKLQNLDSWEKRIPDSLYTFSQ